MTKFVYAHPIGFAVAAAVLFVVAVVLGVIVYLLTHPLDHRDGAGTP